MSKEVIGEQNSAVEAIDSGEEIGKIRGRLRIVRDMARLSLVLMALVAPLSGLKGEIDLMLVSEVVGIIGGVTSIVAGGFLERRRARLEQQWINVSTIDTTAI